MSRLADLASRVTLGRPLEEPTQVGPLQNARQLEHGCRLVVAAIPFEDEEHAIALANDTAYGLAGAVWTGSVDRAHRVARAVRAGTVQINSYKTINVMSPFGGFGDSGYGRSSGRDGLAEYTQAKSVWCETAADAPLPFGY